MARAKKPKFKPKTVKEKLNLLSASGSGYVQDIRYSLGATSRHPTPPEYWVAGEEVRDVPEPEGVSKEDLQRMADDARARFRVLRGEEQARDEWRSMMNRLREAGVILIRHGQDPGPMFRAVEKLLVEVEYKKAA